MLFSILPLAFINPSIRPSKLTIPMLFIIEVLAYVFSIIAPNKLSLPCIIFYLKKIKKTHPFYLISIRHSTFYHHSNNKLHNHEYYFTWTRLQNNSHQPTQISLFLPFCLQSIHPNIWPHPAKVQSLSRAIYLPFIHLNKSHHLNANTFQLHELYHLTNYLRKHHPQNGSIFHNH